MAPIALCHLTRDHLTRSLKSLNATIGDKTWNPGFKSVTLLKVTGGLMDRLHEGYHWKTSTGDVQKYVNSCHLCQTKKTSPIKQYGKNHPLPVPGTGWEWGSMHFLVN